MATYEDGRPVASAPGPGAARATSHHRPTPWLRVGSFHHSGIADPAVARLLARLEIDGPPGARFALTAPGRADVPVPPPRLVAGRGLRRLGRRAFLVAVTISLSAGLASSPAIADPSSQIATTIVVTPAPGAPPAAPGPSAPVGVPHPAAPPSATVPDPAPAAPSSTLAPGTPAPNNAPGLALPTGRGTTTTPAPPPPSAAPVVAAQRPQAATGHKPGGTASAGVPFGAPTPAPPPASHPTPPPPVAVPTAPATRALAAAVGLPLPGNPLFSLAGIGPLGVPDFFIANFQTPPFLITIYQAAAVEFGVPWQVLAAINEVETNYGRNLSPSTAGATGWMQLLPATWRQYAVDANGDGLKEPSNPADAIFTAARFLRAAGAAQNLRGAIAAYNGASWFADSVMLRAKLIGGLPNDLIGGVTGLTDGVFPVRAAAHYGDPGPARPTGPHDAAPARSAMVDIYAAAGSPVVAVHDGVITAIGSSPSLGRFVKLRDASGNTYTYRELGRLSALYAVPKPRTEPAATVAGATPPVADPPPRGPATAGHQTGTGGPPPTASARPATDTTGASTRLFAHPARTATFAAGGWRQLATASHDDLAAYLAPADGLRRRDVDLRPLTAGARVIAGSVLGRIGPAAPGRQAHLSLQIRPAGPATPLIDPKPVLDGWRLLDATAAARGAPTKRLFGPAAGDPTVGQILLESGAQLARQVLADPAIDIYPCGRQDIAAGLVDQRVLATLEFLSASGLRPTVTALRCAAGLANTPFDASGGLSANALGTGVDISAINGIPVLGHQGPASITDLLIQRLIGLQGSFRAAQIVSLNAYPSADNTLAAPDHADRVHIEFAPTGPQVSPLTPAQWPALIARLDRLTNPRVPVAP